MESLSNSFAAQLSELSDYLHGQVVWPSPDVGFAHFVYRHTNERPPSGFVSLTPPPIERFDQAPGLACQGYVAFLTSAGQDSATVEGWVSGFRRLMDRDVFPADRISFAYRPTELLGVVLGCLAHSDTKDAGIPWLCNVLERLDSEPVINRWASGIYLVASSLLSRDLSPLAPVSPEQLNIDDLAMLYWISRSSVDLGNFVPPGSALERFLLLRSLEERITHSDIARVAVLHNSLRTAVYRRIDARLSETLRLKQNEQDAIKIVSLLCRRFPLCTRQLLSRRENRVTLNVKDEYDAQDLMHALLCLHFDDVRPEEWTPSYAGNHSRMDFLLKRERLVVEVKMTRHGLDQREVVNQLSIDKERYRAHQHCDTLFCFVYDPEQRCHNPTALEDDVSREEEHLRTIAIVAPKGI